MNSQFYLCAMCNKHFNFFIELTSHIKTNHENVYLEYFTFQLEREGAAATTPTTPTTLAKEKEKKEKKCHVCPNCCKEFPSGSSLGGHRQGCKDSTEDVQLKRFACKFNDCHKRFIYKHSRTRHHKRNHLFPAAAAAAAVYHCMYKGCRQKTFSTWESVSKHADEAHPAHLASVEKKSSVN